MFIDNPDRLGTVDSTALPAALAPTALVAEYGTQLIDVLPPMRYVEATALQVNAEAALQFIKGVNEPTIPEVKLTRSKDGTNGCATFIFGEPSVFQADSQSGDITGLYMVDEEGTLSTVDVIAKFVDGKPDRIECKYVMRSTFEWDRFMRFMERYAEENGLGFTKGK